MSVTLQYIKEGCCTKLGDNGNHAVASKHIWCWTGHNRCRVFIHKIL